MKLASYTNKSDLALRTTEKDTQPTKELDYPIRGFIPGDEEAIVKLFNSTHKNLAGYVPRTTSYWRWSCLNRPSVEQEGIIIVTRKSEIVGYAVVGKTGDIWELSYVHDSDSSIIVENLLSRAIEYARSANADSIVLNEDAQDKIVKKTCEQLDFIEAPSELAFVSIMNFPCLIYQALQSRKDELNLEGTFRFIIKNCPPWCINHFTIQLENKDISLIKETEKQQTTITIDVETLTSLIFGGRSISNSLISKIKVQPFWKIQKSLKLLNYLKLDSDWFIPKADIG